MSKQLLVKYLRLAVQEAHLARVPNQLVSDTEQGQSEEDNDQTDVNEFAAAGGGGGVSLSSGNVMGHTAPLGAGKQRRKKN